MNVLATLRDRRPYAAVYMPRARAHPFGVNLVARLLEHGFAAYPVELDGDRRALWRAPRAMQPDTSLAFVEYAPGDYDALGLLLATLRWHARGAAVVLCRHERRPRDPLEALVYRVVRALAGHELVVRDDDALRTLASWSASAMPSRAPLANVWVARPDRAHVRDIVDVLRCPSCRGALALSHEGLVCEPCARVYAVEDGIPVLLPEGAHAQVEEHEHEHGYETGDPYRVGSDENRAWLEIGYWKRDLIARMVRGRTPRTSIDIGCGDWGVHHDVVGTIGTEFAVAGDVSLRLASHARSAAIAPGRVHHVVLSADALPFRDGLFELTYCSEVLEHVDHPDRAVAEMARAGRGGRAILTVPNEEVAGKLEAGHVQSFGYDSFLALLRPHVDVREIKGVFLMREMEVAKALTRPFLGLPLGFVRFRAALAMGERRPRKSLQIMVDGTLRAA